MSFQINNLKYAVAVAILAGLGLSQQAYAADGQQFWRNFRGRSAGPSQKPNQVQHAPRFQSDGQRGGSRALQFKPSAPAPQQPNKNAGQVPNATRFQSDGQRGGSRVLQFKPSAPVPQQPSQNAGQVQQSPRFQSDGQRGGNRVLQFKPSTPIPFQNGNLGISGQGAPRPSQNAGQVPNPTRFQYDGPRGGSGIGLPPTSSHPTAKPPLVPGSQPGGGNLPKTADTLPPGAREMFQRNDGVVGKPSDAVSDRASQTTSKIQGQPINGISFFPTIPNPIEVVEDAVDAAGDVVDAVGDVVDGTGKVVSAAGHVLFEPPDLLAPPYIPPKPVKRLGKVKPVPGADDSPVDYGSLGQKGGGGPTNRFTEGVGPSAGRDAVVRTPVGGGAAGNGAPPAGGTPGPGTPGPGPTGNAGQGGGNGGFQFPFPLPIPSLPQPAPSYPVGQASYPVEQASYPVEQASYPVEQASYPDELSPAPAANEAAEQVSVARPVIAETGSVDLILEDVVWSANATRIAGPAYTVRFRNQGTQDAGKFVFAAVASLDGALSQDAPRVVMDVPSLEAGATQDLVLRLPAAAMKMTNASGQHVEFGHLILIVDATEAIDEVDETNNAAVVSRAELEEAAQ